MTKLVFHVSNQVYNKRLVRAVCSVAELVLEEFDTAEAALVKCASEAPDLIITQLDLMGMDGIELHKELRATKIERLLFTRYPPALPEFANNTWGLQTTRTPLAPSPLIESIVSKLSLELDSNQTTTMASLAQASNDLEPLLELLRHTELPKPWLKNLVPFVAQLKPYNRRLVFLQQLMTSAFPLQVREDALRLLVEHGGARASFFGQLLCEPQMPESLLRTCIEHLDETCFEEDALAWLSPFLDGDSSWLRILAARATLSISKRLSANGADGLRNLARRSDLAYDLRGEAAQALMALGHVPPANVLRDFAPLDSGFETARTDLGEIKKHTATLADESAKSSERCDSLRKLGLSIDARQFRSICIKKLQHVDPILAATAFTSLMHKSMWNVDDMESLIEFVELPNSFRIACVLSVGQRAKVSDARRILKKTLFTPASELQDSALTAIVLAGESQQCLLLAASQDPVLALSLRARALRQLCRVGPDARLELLASLVDESESRISMTACELMISALGGDSGAFIDGRLSKLSSDHQHAGLEGALQLGAAGFMILVAFALQVEFSADVRLRALRILEMLASDEVSSEYVSNLKNELLPKLRPRTAQPPPIPDASDTSIVITERAVPAGQLEMEKADTMEVEPAVAEDLPSPPTKRPQSKMPLRLSSSRENEARQKLAAAFDQGLQGFESLSEIVCMPSYPENIRNTALRHMIHTFETNQMQPILEYALTLGTPTMQHTALTGRLEANGTSLAALKQAVEDIGNSPDIRLRALSRLHVLSGRNESMILICEALFREQNPDLHEAALTIVFPSLRYIQSNAIESSLINLFEEHSDSRVRCSAAHALGALGGRNAIDVLTKASARRLVKSELSTAMKQALASIKTRLT